MKGHNLSGLVILLNFNLEHLAGTGYYCSNGDTDVSLGSCRHFSVYTTLNQRPVSTENQIYAVAGKETNTLQLDALNQKCTS